MFFSTYPDSERAFARAEAYQAATLNDWLVALAKDVEDGVRHLTQPAFQRIVGEHRTCIPTSNEWISNACFGTKHPFDNRIMENTMEECVVHATIGGYPIASTVNRYNRWRFRPEDRIIRCRRREQHNPLIYGMPIDELDAEVVDTQFVYSTTADTLRRRLGRAGFNRASLDKEFWKYYEIVVHCSELGSLHFTGESARAYGDAFSGMLDDWLDALAEAVKAGVTPARRAVEGFKPTGNPLVDIITGPDTPEFEELQPEHGLLGFPCSSFDNTAVALLEVTAGNAICELDVTSFILHRGDITFDDMLGRRDEY